MITIVAVTGSLYAASGADWNAVYTGLSSGPGQEGFIEGGAHLIHEGWGFSLAFSETMLAVMVVLFAGTTMDAGLRLQRYIIQEWGNIYSINPLKNNYISTLLAIFACLALAFGVTNSNYETLGDGGMLIWPVFGATNQILASMTLLTIAVFLVKLGRPARYVLAPMVFILFAALWASGWYLINHFQGGQWVLVIIEVLVVVTTVFIILEALSVLFKAKSEQSGGDDAVASNE